MNEHERRVLEAARTEINRVHQRMTGGPDKAILGAVERDIRDLLVNSEIADQKAKQD